MANGLFAQLNLDMMFGGDGGSENGSSSRNSSSTFTAADQQKAQTDAVAAAAAFLLNMPTISGNSQPAMPSSYGAAATSSSTACASLTGGSGVVQHQPISQKGNIWTHLGTFQLEEEMHRVRNKEKVSKRRTEQLKNGTKIRYRCNTWKRTKCGFQMFSFYSAHTGLIDLYECGEHDHTGRRKLEYELYGPIRRRLMVPALQNNNIGQTTKPNAVTPSSTTKNAGTNAKMPIVTSANDPQKTLLKAIFSLEDPEKAAQLSALAFDFNLDLSRDGVSGNQLTFCADGKFILKLVESFGMVKLTAPGTDSEEEQTWLKADWNQFLWAMRGILASLTAK